MTVQDTATAHRSIAVGGTVLAGLGVIAFSLTFPATRWALTGFGAWSATTLRAVLAGVIVGVCLVVARVPVPQRRHWPGLAVVALGVVLGFPLLTTLALRTTDSSHAAVVAGALPLVTAALAAARVGSRPSRLFWVAAGVGGTIVVGFALVQGRGTLTPGDLFLFASLPVCAAGYVEGGRLASVIPGWQVVGWALVGALPLTVPAAAVALATEPVHPGVRALVGITWIAVGTQFLGLMAWYRGMAAIGVARASQLELARPLLTLAWAAALLGEHLSALTAPAALAVLICIAVTQRAARSDGMS